jgi:CMP/dCMP kinase
MKITISGAVGSGKSTISRILAKKLTYTHYSTGEMMRELAKKRNLSIMELSERAETDPTIDEELDQMQTKIGMEQENLIMDSRLGFHFIKDSFKVFLTVDIKEAARRIFKDKRSEETYKDVKEAEKYLKRRMKSENIRYKEYYGIDFPKKRYFNLIIDTTDKTVEDVTEEIIQAIKKTSV